MSKRPGQVGVDEPLQQCGDGPLEERGEQPDDEHQADAERDQRHGQQDPTCTCVTSGPAVEQVIA